MGAVIAQAAQFFYQFLLLFYFFSSDVWGGGLGPVSKEGLSLETKQLRVLLKNLENYAMTRTRGPIFVLLDKKSLPCIRPY